MPGARKERARSGEEKGRHRCLLDTFNRINVDYFQSALEVPNLCWSPVKARRVLPLAIE